VTADELLPRRGGGARDVERARLFEEDHFERGHCPIRRVAPLITGHWALYFSDFSDFTRKQHNCGAPEIPRPPPSCFLREGYSNLGAPRHVRTGTTSATKRSDSTKLATTGNRDETERGEQLSLWLTSFVRSGVRGRHKFRGPD